MSQGEAYRSIQERITDLVDESNADDKVPTLPGWTVKDVIAHNAGFITTFKSGGRRPSDRIGVIGPSRNGAGTRSRTA